MTLESRVRQRLREKKRNPSYQAEKLSLAVTEEIAKAMAAKKVNKAELARRLGVSKARVTRLLNGSPNLTLKTLAYIGVALESEFEIDLRAWVDSWSGVFAPERTIPSVALRSATSHEGTTIRDSRAATESDGEVSEKPVKSTRSPRSASRISSRKR